MVMKDTLIIFDAGGVLLRNGLSAFFAALAPLTECSFDDIRTFYVNELREKSQRGECSIDEFWDKISAFCNLDASHQDLDEAFINSLVRLGETPVIHRWKQHADLWLLSNHRTPWLQPALGPLWDLMDKRFISSETGYLKPEKAAYTQLQPYLEPYKHIRFIDDKKKNVQAMKRHLGIEGIVADADGMWNAQIDAWLKDLASKSGASIPT